jgi:hypothetical protein
MKKIIATVILSIFLSIFAIAQQKTAFTFVTTSIQNLEKKAKNNDDGMSGDLFSTPILKKRMLGVYLVDDIATSVDYNSDKYIKFSAIPITDKFEMLTNDEYGSSNWENNLFFENIKTKQKYAVMVFPIRTLQDYSNMSNESNGNGWLTKDCPKEKTPDEKLLIEKYKALIKSANANIAILLTIQKKCLTRSYFDEKKVTASDKIIYNKNLIALKSKAEKLADIDRYEDKNDKAQDELTISELGSLNNINDWNTNYFKLE